MCSIFPYYSSHTEDLKENGTFYACNNIQTPIYKLTLLDSSHKKEHQYLSQLHLRKVSVMGCAQEEGQGAQIAGPCYMSEQDK